MANKSIKKIPFYENRFREALEFSQISINKLCHPTEGFGRTRKQLYRYLNQKEIPENVLDEMGKFLNVEPDYISGEYDRKIDNIKNSEIQKIFKEQLNVKDHPYIKKLQNNKVDEKFIEEDYFEKLLIVHGISPQQLYSLNRKAQLEFQLEIENSIIPILMKYFKFDAAMKNSFESIWRLSAEIENAIDEITTKKQQE